MPRANPAPCCVAALAQASRRWPTRSRASDGIVPSRAHTSANPRSDHEVGKSGYNRAFDLTHDPDSGCNCSLVSERIRKACAGGTEKRVKYLIYNRRIASPVKRWAWRPYSGSNPHTKHMHVSVLDTKAACEDTSGWPGIAEPSRPTRYRITKTHGARRFPWPVSPMRGKFIEGDVHTYAVGTSGGYRKLYLSPGVQAWAIARFCEQVK